MTNHRLPPNVYRHVAAGFVGFRVQFKGNEVLPTVQRYFSETALGYRIALREAKAFAEHVRETRFAHPKYNAGRITHTTPVRGKSGIRGVTKVRDSWLAQWYDPPGVQNRVYTGTGEWGLRQAKRIRKEAELLILAGKSTKHLLQAR